MIFSGNSMAVLGGCQTGLDNSALRLPEPIARWPGDCVTFDMLATYHHTRV